MPESDKILRFIQQAGQNGVTKADLYGAKLGRHIIDELLAGMANSA